MDMFLERYKLPKITQEGTEYLSRPRTIRKTEWLIKKLPQRKSQAQETALWTLPNI